jgi:hypothetical protein
MEQTLEITELENLGVSLCLSLLHSDFTRIAEHLGYALAGEKPSALAIKEDFERSLKESRGTLEHSKYDVVIKTFPRGAPGFVNLVECRFVFPNNPCEILVEIIENECGCYLEQISCVCK